MSSERRSMRAQATFSAFVFLISFDIGMANYIALQHPRSPTHYLPQFRLHPLFSICLNSSLEIPIMRPKGGVMTLKPSRFLDPKADVVFKKIFGDHPHLIKSFLNGVMPFQEGQYIVS